MSHWFAGLFDRVWDYLIPDETELTPKKDGPKELLDGVDQAHKEWLTARTYFDNVTDPDLVDHAIYAIEAAERKYVYLLRRAREMGYELAEYSLEVRESPPPPATSGSSVDRRDTDVSGSSAPQREDSDSHPVMTS